MMAIEICALSAARINSRLSYHFKIIYLLRLLLQLLSGTRDTRCSPTSSPSPAPDQHLHLHLHSGVIFHALCRSEDTHTYAQCGTLALGTWHSRMPKNAHTAVDNWNCTDWGRRWLRFHRDAGLYSGVSSVQQPALGGSTYSGTYC